MEQARKIKAAKLSEFPLVFPLHGREHGAEWYWEVLAASYGGMREPLWDNKMNPTFVSPQSSGYKALKFLQDALKEKILDPASLEVESTFRLARPMAEGTAAFTIITPFLYPAACDPKARSGKDIDVMMMPETHYTWSAAVAMGITTAAKRKGDRTFQAAWEVLKYYGGVELRSLFARDFLFSPPYRGMWKDQAIRAAFAQYVDVAVETKQEESYTVGLESWLSPVARRRGYLKFREDVLTPGLRSVLLGSRGIDQALSEIAEGSRKLR
jgi:ABC-type glycerol-3-phosphate transport system substrate-binding protein